MKSLYLTRRLCTLAVAGLLLASVTLAGLAQSAMPSAETLEKLAKEAYAKFKDDKGGKMAIVGFAPPLDKFGNSVRAQEAIRYISEQLDLNIFGSSK